MRLERDGDAEEVPRETLNAGTDDRNYGFNSPHLLRSTENITAEVVDEQQSDEQVADASTSLASPSLLEISEARNAQLQTELDAVLAALQERNMNLRDLRDRHEGACIELDTLKRFIAAEDERDAERSMAAELHDDGQEMSEDCITATAKASIASAQSAEPRNSTASSSLVDDGDAAVPSALNTDPSFGLSVSSVASSVREESSSSSSSSSGGTRMERSKLLLALVHLEDSVKLQKRTTGETEARLRRAQTTVHGVRRQLRRANDRIEDMEKGNANVLRPLKARIEALVAELAAGNAENAKAVARAIDASEARKAAEKLAEEATTAAAEAARKQKCAEEAASELEADLAALEESAAEEVEMRVKKGCHALTRDLDEAHDRQQELNTELKAALKSLKEEKAAHKEVQEELSGTQSRLQGAVDESDRLKAAAEAQRALVEQLEAAAEAHEINITAVRQSALDREERIASLEGFVEKGATRVTELTHKQLEMRTHQDHLSRILQMKHVEIAALEVKAQKDARAMKVAAEAAAADAEAAVQAREALKIQHQHSIAALQARRNVWKERAIASRAQVRRLRVEYDVGEEEYDAADDREEEEWEEDDEDDNDGDDDSIDAASATSSLNNGTKNTIITNTAAGAGRRVGISTLRSGTRGATTVPARVSVQVGVAVQCTDLLGSTDEALEALRLAETLRSLARSSLATAEGERAQASGEEGSSGLVEMLHSLLLHAHGGTSKVPAAAESLRLQHLDHNQPNGPQLRAHTPLSGWPGVNERALPEGGHRSRRGESQGRTETEEVGKATPRGMMQHQQQQLGKKEKGAVGARIALEGNQQKQRRAKGKSELKEIGQGRAMRSKMKCQKQGRQRRRRRRRRKGKADSSSDDDDDDDDDEEEEEIGDHGGQTKHGVNGMGPESPDPNMSVDRSTVLRYDGVDEGDDGEEQGGEDESVMTPVPVTTGSDARSKAVQEKLHAAEARERSWKSSFIGSPGDMHHQFAPHHDQRGEPGSNDDCDDDSKSSTPAIDEHGFLEGGAADILLHNVFLAEAGGARKRAELRKKLGEQQRHPIDFRESMGGVSPVSTPSISGAAFSLTTPLPSPYQHQSALGSTVNPPGSSMLIKEDRFAKRHGVGAVDLHSAYLPKIDPARTSGKTNVFSFPNYDDDDDDHDDDKRNRPRGTDTNRRTKNRESRDISYFNNGEQASSSAPPTPESMGRSLLIASAGL